MTEKTYSLYQLNEYIQRVIDLNFNDTIWIEAEINAVSHSKGHYYLQLIEKEDDALNPRAQAQAMIWRHVWSQWSDDKKSIISSGISAGVSVRICVQVQFHLRFGISLHVEEIDLQYTIGRLEQQRRAMLQKLQAENLLNRNAERTMPIVVQRIAVISSSGAAGLEDFLKQLQHNRYGYTYNHCLYDCAVQGQYAAVEMVDALVKIADRATEYDVVVMVRGGGSNIDLLAFDEESLCRAVADCPLPVLVGIGHETDTVAVDYVAHQSFKTPTAVAGYLVDKTLAYEQSLLEIATSVRASVMPVLEQHVLQLQSHRQSLSFAAQVYFQKRQYAQQEWLDHWQSGLEKYFTAQENHLSLLETQLQGLHPDHVLARGYTLTYLHDRPINDNHWPQPGQRITTHTAQGMLHSTIVDDTQQ